MNVFKQILCMSLMASVHTTVKSSGELEPKSLRASDGSIYATAYRQVLKQQRKIRSQLRVQDLSEVLGQTSRSIPTLILPKAVIIPRSPVAQSVSQSLSQHVHYHHTSSIGSFSRKPQPAGLSFALPGQCCP